ncbi:UNVERIFIED_CONTAM: hypothetical protein FKN15_072097 [Acipenser sinensis]
MVHTDKFQAPDQKFPSPQGSNKRSITICFSQPSGSVKDIEPAFCSTENQFGT